MLKETKQIWKNFFLWGWKIWTKKAWTYCLLCDTPLKHNKYKHLVGTCYSFERK